VVLHGMNQDVSFWQHPFDWLDDAVDDVRDQFDLETFARDTVDFGEHVVNGLSVADWVLLAVAAGLVYWVASSLRAVTRLGPVGVDTLEHDGLETTAAPVKALTAQLREALARSGLSPAPAVPAGTPQVNLLDAIKESPIPQANWIASLLQLVPRPRPSEYKISGVLMGIESAAPDYPPPCGLRFSVLPVGVGSGDLDTVDGYMQHSAAVAAAASEIYLHISQDATGAFPIWARWRTAESLEAYVDSAQLLNQNRIAEAIAQLVKAKRREPFNALPALQIANLSEQAIPVRQPRESDGARAVRMIEQAKWQADALSRYLAVANDWPELVEARYRTSVTAAALASTLPELDQAEGMEVLAFLGLPAVDTIVQLHKRLRFIAERESAAVRQMLRPWYALLNDFRLRTQFEPKAQQRRELRRTVAISKHCHRMRRILDQTHSWTWAEVLYRSTMVHAVHLGLGWGSASWQAHYNAACFDALLWDYLLRRGT
jgi:hypothetical protein